MRLRSRTAASMLLALLALISLSAQHASEAAIYKCKNGDTFSYSDQPCLNGEVLALPSGEKPGAAGDQADTRARGQAHLQQEKVRLKQLEQEKNASKTAAAQEQKRRQQQSKSVAAARKKCDSLAQRKRWAEEDLASLQASATAKKEAQIEKARRKARRAAELHLAGCSAAP
jgi:hypothetical protein